MTIASTAVSSRERPESTIRTRVLYEAHVSFGAPLDVGATPHGVRRIVPFTGGTFQGPYIRGEILPGGADWLLVRPDGVAEVDIRTAGRTDDGAVIYATERGYLCAPPDVFQRIARGERVDPDAYTFRLIATYETSSPRYAWLNGTIGLGLVTLRDGGIDLVVHEVL